jgi:Tol biopolymer transport system component
MSLREGERLGPYEVLARLGAGGMGEVFRARDGRLGREVAIKVVRAQVSSDPDRLRRFEQEARAAAALNHPNILAVYDVGFEGGAPFLVSELLSGATLRDVLQKGAVPAGTAIDYARQIASGLASAHEKGIVHRDLKPENLFLTDDGRIKILDFGLAKILPGIGSDEQPTEAREGALTGTGVILGTVGYLSPEQIRGEPADHRSDIFSFGSVLYELLSGERAFQGGTAAETMTEILNQEPRDLDPGIPPAAERLMRVCLRKDPRARWQSARDLLLALEALTGGTVPRRAKASLRLGPIAVAALLLAIAGTGLWLSRSRVSVPAATPVRFEISPPSGAHFTAINDPVFYHFAVSPDGAKLVYVASEGESGPSRLWLRSLGEWAARPLPDTEEARFPFWAPDGKAVAFSVGNRLRRLDLSATSPRTLAEASSTLIGGTWSREGVILISSWRTAIHRVPESGGDAVPVTQPGEGETHAWPEFLPDGRSFLFWVRRRDAPSFVIRVGRLDTFEANDLLEADSRALFAEPNHLLTVRNGSLLRFRFDPGTLSLSRDPVRIAEGLGYGAPPGFSSFTVAGEKLLAFARGPVASRELRWFDRKGRDLGSIGEPGYLYAPVLSPDETRIAFTERDPGSARWGIVTFDREREILSRYGEPGRSLRSGFWSPDGSRLAVTEELQGIVTLFVASKAGGAARPVGEFVDFFATQWPSSCDCLIYHAALEGGRKVGMVSLETGKLTPVASSAGDEFYGQLSPDGRWLAYTSDEGGSLQVWLRSFPEADVRIQVSSGGGSEPVWASSGREIFYVSLDGTLTSVLISPSSPPELGRARPLFHVDLPPLRRPFWPRYTVSRDGERFLVVHLLRDETTLPIYAVTNWAAEE